MKYIVKYQDNFGELYFGSLEQILFSETGILDIYLTPTQQLKIIRRIFQQLLKNRGINTGFPTNYSFKIMSEYEILHKI